MILFRSVTNALQSAKTRSALIAVAQEIQNMPEHWQRDAAARIVKQKLAEFKRN